MRQKSSVYRERAQVTAALKTANRRKAELWEEGGRSAVSRGEGEGERESDRRGVGGTCVQGQRRTGHKEKQKKRFCGVRSTLSSLKPDPWGLSLFSIRTQLIDANSFAFAERERRLGMCDEVDPRHMVAQSPW